MRHAFTFLCSAALLAIGGGVSIAAFPDDKVFAGACALAALVFLGLAILLAWNEDRRV